MNTTELKKLAEQCICHPISRSTTEVENAGEAIISLLALNAELVEALKLSLLIIGHPDDSHSQYLAEVIAKAEGGEL